MSADAPYLDSSAFVKLVVIEPETQALVTHLSTRGRAASSALLRVEVVRAIRRVAADRLHATYRALDDLDLVPLDDELLRTAAGIDADDLRTLDAIHVAAAASLGPDLAELITYDRRMADAARDLGLPVVAPA